MEKIENNKTSDLLERVIDIARMADKCHRLGFIEDYVIKVDVTTENDYEVEVRIDSYRASEKRWCVSERSYREEQTPPTGDPEKLAAYLYGLIDDRKAQLRAELQILEEE